MDSDEFRRMADAGERHWWYRNTRSLLRELTEAHLDPVHDAVYLDAAGGTGATGGWLAERVATVDADYDTFALDVARHDHRGYLPVRADLNDLPFAPGVFDAILCVTALCHRMNPDPQAVVADFARLARPGAVVVLMEPGGRRLRRGHDEVTHTGRRFSVGDLRDLAIGAGLDVIRATGAYTFLVPPAWAMGVVGRRRTAGTPRSDVGRHASGLGGALGAVAALERRLLRRVDVPFGLSAIVVARRPFPAASLVPTTTLSGAHDDDHDGTTAPTQP